MNLAMAATYDPDPARAATASALPFNLETGELHARRAGSAGCEHDPVNLVARTEAT